MSRAGNSGSGKISKKKRARQRRAIRRALAGLFGLLAVAVAVLAIKAAPGFGAMIWGVAALMLLGEALLLLLKRPLPVYVYAVAALACLMLLVAGGGGRRVELDRALQRAEVSAAQSQAALAAEPLPNKGEEALAPDDPAAEGLDDASSGDPSFGDGAGEAPAASPTPEADVTLLGVSFPPDTETIELQNAGDIDPDAVNAALARLGAVRQVDLRGTPLSAEAIGAMVSANPEVRFLCSCDVPGGSMTTEDAEVVVPGGGYEQLRAWADFIDYMPNLQHMDARAVQLTEAEVAELQQDPRARKLIYQFTAFGRSISTLDTELNLDDVPMTGTEEIERIVGAMPNLTRVSMCNCGLTDEAMGGLCDRHPEVRFIWWIHFGKYTLRTDATAFTTNLYDNNSYGYTSGTFWPLQYCTDLMMLDIGHCKLTNIEAIAKMKKLRVLILADNKISDISPLAELNDLEYVEVFLNDISDLTPLANKPNLIDLNLYYNPLGDISPICTCTSLQRLWIGKCNLSKGQLSKLHEALPNCKINARGSSSTGNGWRDHKRYKVIKQMYKQGQYIPFS